MPAGILGTSGSDEYRKKLALMLAQQGLDSSPIQSGWQGASRMAHALLAGLEMRDMEQREKAAPTELLSILGSGQPTAPAAAGSAPQPNTPPQKIYSNNEPSPLDPPGGSDRDRLIRVMHAEAAGQPATGQQAVANVVRNRAVSGQYGGDTVAGVLAKPHAFEPTMTQQGQARMASLNPNSPEYAQYGQAVDKAYKGDDPTGGATHFFAPQAQAALGRQPPAWSQGQQGQPIGGHTFYKPDQVVQAAPAMPQQTGQVNQQQIEQMVRSQNPQIRNFGLQLLQQRLTPEKPTDDIREYSLYRQQGGNKSFFDYMADLKKAGSTQVTVDQRAGSEYQKVTDKQFAEQNVEIIKGAQNARGKIATLARLGQLLSDPSIHTGTGGELVLEAKRLAKAAGFDVGDVGGAEAVRAISNQFALEIRNPAGGAGMPGALSDKDREFLQSIPPGLGKTPEGNKQIIDYLKRVNQRSVDVDRLRQEYVKRTGKVDEGFYQVLSQYSEQNPIFPEATKAKPAPTQPQPPAATPTLEQIEQEILKRRGRK